MIQAKVRALKYQVESVGKHIKASKKRFLWVVAVGDRVFNFILDDSLVSGKSKLSINGKIFHQNEQQTIKRCKYNHSFFIEGCLFNIVENDDSYEMRINNKLFSHLLTLQMNQLNFSKHEEVGSSFEIDQKIKQSQSKKITLNIPGMGNGMKKKKGPAAQSQNWNGFAGDTAFPSFFGQPQPQKQTPIPKQQPQTLKHETPLQLKQQELPTPEQFSTLQNLFQTIKQSGTYEQKLVQGTTPVYNVTQIPAIPQINLMEFNTMQNLFSTVSQTQEQESKLEPPSSKISENGENKEDPFNTMQNLFSTLKLSTTNISPTPTAQSVSPTIPSPPVDCTKVNLQDFAKVNLQDFTTMQRLFTTNSMPKQTPLTSIKVTELNPTDFSTMQHLFATNQLPIPSNQLPISSNQQVIKSKEEPKIVHQLPTTEMQTIKTEVNTTLPINMTNINLNDFSTMQQLFATNSFTAPKSDQVLGSTNKTNLVDKPEQMKFDLAAVSPNDFNTMQNLFKTGVLPDKKQNQFWQF